MTIIDFFNPNHFIGQAVWALLLLSLLTAPMGCFMVWRKLSYFGATLAHSAILGAILGLLTGVGVLVGVIGFTAILAVLLSFWLNHRLLAGDTVLGMVAHLSLAVGVIAVSLMDNLRIDLMVYLFGDVLAVSKTMFYAMMVIAALGVVLIIIYWRSFVNLAIQRDIAKVEGYAINQSDVVFSLVLSMTIALGMLSIGVLLIIAMLIIPAATARLFARSLKQMVMLAWIFSVLSILFGISGAYWVNFPAGPTVVVAAGLLFILSSSLRWLRQ
ncbi:MAG: metal ABC transporter permease [Ostreibacterium sp.]